MLVDHNDVEIAATFPIENITIFKLINCVVHVGPVRQDNHGMTHYQVMAKATR